MLEHIILGIIQGLTEFLPVSSSAHLVLGHRLFGLAPNIAFDIVVHLATLFAVLIYFWKDIINLIKSFFAAVFSVVLGKTSLASTWKENFEFRFSCFVLVSTFITACIGFAFSDFFESLFSSVKAASFFLLVTAFIILFAEKFSKPKKSITGIRFLDSVILGFAQSLAIAPGLSRSGTTVSAGLLLGFERELAAKYSFILSIPTILGAGILQAKEVVFSSTHSGGSFMLAGGLSALISGVFAIYIFMKIIKTSTLRPFAYYCIIVGLLALILL